MLLKLANIHASVLSTLYFYLHRLKIHSSSVKLPQKRIRNKSENRNVLKTKLVRAFLNAFGGQSLRLRGRSEINT